MSHLCRSPWEARGNKSPPVGPHPLVPLADLAAYAAALASEGGAGDLAVNAMHSWAPLSRRLFVLRQRRAAKPLVVIEAVRQVAALALWSGCWQRWCGQVPIWTRNGPGGPWLCVEVDPMHHPVTAWLSLPGCKAVGFGLFVGVLRQL